MYSLIFTYSDNIRIHSAYLVIFTQFKLIGSNITPTKVGIIDTDFTYVNISM